MLKAVTLVAAAAAAQNATINLFTAVDKPAYLAELAASMRHAYELEPRRRRGRRYRWFVLYRFRPTVPPPTGSAAGRRPD